ncbi:MAG: hypothetical protein JXA68_03985 [Ignavibacteriales bacterium]|nr:hypothetical protein [Ignavibacteriales bacterium]
MKKLIFLVSLFVCTISFSQNNEVYTVEISDVPTSIESFTSLRDELSVTPQGGASVFVVAMLMYVQNAELGIQAFTIALDRNNLVEDNSGYKGFKPDKSFTYMVQNYLQPRPYLANSYLLNTTFTDGYVLPSKPYQIKLSTNPYSQISETEIKLFIECSGADSPRPIIMKKNDKGIWKTSNYSSLFVGIKTPPVSDDL